MDACENICNSKEDLWSRLVLCLLQILLKVQCGIDV